LAVALAAGLGVPCAGPLPSFAQDDPPPSDTAPEKPSKLRSPEDGWFDVSAFLDESWGFVPLAMPITEPAVGYGAGGGLAFIGKPQEVTASFSRPSITFVGGLGTENGTWGVAAVDYREWKHDRLQTLVGLFDASVNLDFYGIGGESAREGDPLTYNLKPLGGLVQAKYRMGGSRAWVGLNYTFASTDVSFDAPAETPGRPDFEQVSRVGGLTPSLTYDSRDSLFTPVRGTYVEASARFYDRALGGDESFQQVGLIAMEYVRLHPRWTLGLRGDATFSFNDAPFYMLPYVSLRGAALMRYQGVHVAQAEVELRWQFWRRFSLVGFAGDGAAWTEWKRFENKKTVVTGGGGFRYELARKYKMHMGLDVAFGPDGAALYVQFGSAWMRP
jgi:hypothetical protein